MPPIAASLAFFAILAVLVFFSANRDLANTLSPQGCRMSYMSPSYVSQVGFNASWTPLAMRYSLWLYREVGWDHQVASGLPVLFIPGNAGSSHQARSIASSASRQFYSSPGQVSLEFRSRGIQSLDVYAVEFNEDLSAFHGSTLQSQIEYTSKAVEYILSQYPPGTSLVVLGHSMGGIVGTALLPSKHISTVITMSTPHTLPPARFDSRIDDIYAKIHHVLSNDTTPILSVCGGATDMMIPSESCILPPMNGNTYRRTVFTSSLEGAWTGVGHREMVWCHQVRWRIARAVLELAPQTSLAARKVILDTWLRDGHTLPTGDSEYAEENQSLWLSDRGSYDILPSGSQLAQKPVGSHVYLLPIPTEDGLGPPKLSVLVGQGSISSVSSQTQHSLQVSIYICSPTGEEDNSPKCSFLQPATLKLLPRPIPGELFPRPRIDSDSSSGGADESEGVVLYEADIRGSRSQWIGIKVDGGQGDGWVVAGFNPREAITHVTSTTSLLFGNAFIHIKARGSLKLDIRFPHLQSNAIIVYRLVPRFREVDLCYDTVLAPIVVHTSHSVETHYYPLIRAGDRRILLHTHHPAPYQTKLDGDGKGLHLTIFSSGESGCIDQLEGLEISVDWSATLGRLASRYLITLVGWSAGVSAILLFLALGIHDRGAPMPSITQSLRSYERTLSRFMLPASAFASFFPWPRELYLGLENPGLSAPLAPLILLVASGLVVVSWWVLQISLLISRPLGRIFATRRHEGTSVGRSTIASMCIIFALIFLFVPWQVAFLGCWMYQFLTCAVVEPEEISANRVAESYPLPSLPDQEDEPDGFTRPQANERARERAIISQNNYRLNLHILLFMTWLLPLVAPVLAVWVRTLITAGLTTPFDGDHFFMSVAPFLVLVDFASWTSTPTLLRQSFEDQISTRWAFALVAIMSFLVGGTRPHRIFDAGKIAVGLLVGVRIGRRYWGGASWTAPAPRRQGT